MLLVFKIHWHRLSHIVNQHRLWPWLCIHTQRTHPPWKTSKYQYKSYLSSIVAYYIRDSKQNGKTCSASCPFIINVCLLSWSHNLNLYKKTEQQVLPQQYPGICTGTTVFIIITTYQLKNSQSVKKGVALCKMASMKSCEIQVAAT